MSETDAPKFRYVMLERKIKELEKLSSIQLEAEKTWYDKVEKLKPYIQHKSGCDTEMAYKCNCGLEYVKGLV